jgi:hypothetical protein
MPQIVQNIPIWSQMLLNAPKMCPNQSKWSKRLKKNVHNYNFMKTEMLYKLKFHHTRNIIQTKISSQQKIRRQSQNLNPEIYSNSYGLFLPFSECVLTFMAIFGRQL